MIQFMMNHIIVDQFAILSEESLLSTDKAQLNSQIGFKMDFNNHLIATTMCFKFEKNDELFMILEVTCHFAIEPNDWKMLISENSIIFPKDFLAHLGMHTIGTARGILHCKTEGTTFNTCILPPINVVQMIPEDLVAPLES